MARIGFLGTGEIASAMVQTLIEAGHSIIVSHRNERVSEGLVRRYPQLRRSTNQAVVDESDIVVLCLLAEAARNELPNLVFGDDKTVISVMAGVPVAELELLCAPATEICLAIPLPPISLTHTPLAIFPDNSALREILGSHTSIHVCASESELSAHFGATAVLLPFLDQMDVVANWLSGFTNDQTKAVNYVAGLVGAYCTMLTQEPAPDLAQLRTGLSTEGGLNQALSRALAYNGTLATLKFSLDDFRERLNLPPKEY